MYSKCSSIASHILSQNAEKLFTIIPNVTNTFFSTNKQTVNLQAITQVATPRERIRTWNYLQVIRQELNFEENPTHVLLFECLGRNHAYCQNSLNCCCDIHEARLSNTTRKPFIFSRDGDNGLFKLKDIYPVCTCHRRYRVMLRNLIQAGCKNKSRTSTHVGFVAQRKSDIYIYRHMK